MYMIAHIFVKVENCVGRAEVNLYLLIFNMNISLFYSKSGLSEGRDVKVHVLTVTVLVHIVMLCINVLHLQLMKFFLREFSIRSLHTQKELIERNISNS